MSRYGEKDSTPLFTVVIPNKNRAQYLHHTLRTCMTQDYERLEVLVSDDGSTENNREVVEDATRRDSRIRFVSHGTGIGMRDNFEYALRQVKPGFVIALGGDDGLLPGGIRGMHELLQETGTEMLSWPAPRFSYPGVLGPHGQLAIYKERGTRIIDSQTFLRRQATTLHYLGDVESPMFYVKGVVSTRLVDRVRDRSPEGRFYSCPTPDGYSGIVLAGETSHFAFSGKPFAMHGVSSDSQGLAHISNGERARESTQQFLQSVSSRPMHEELASQPYSPLITLMTADYLLTVRDLPGWGGSFPPLDYRSLLRKALSELAHGLYGDERVCRELGILHQIAQRHGLAEYFQDMVRGSRRMRKRAPFEGSGINAVAWFHDARPFELGNIADAAYAAKYLYQAYSDATPSALFRVVARSLLYRLRAMRRGDPFPSVSEWGAQDDVPARVGSVVG